jgi:hypothetical protein
MSEWQPIATAPKDGTEILAWREDCGAFLASWTAPINFLSEQQIEDELGDMEGEDRESLAEAMASYSWFGGDSTLGGFRCEGSEEPTRWMPLPPPPCYEEPEEQENAE